VLAEGDACQVEVEVSEDSPARILQDNFGIFLSNDKLLKQFFKPIVQIFVTAGKRGLKVVLGSKEV